MTDITRVCSSPSCWVCKSGEQPAPTIRLATGNKAMELRDDIGQDGTVPEKTYTPPPVTGYRNLTEHEVRLMNRIKAKGEELGALIAELKLTPELDQRWIAEGNTDLQKGIMCLVRGVARPTSF